MWRSRSSPIASGGRRCLTSPGTRSECRPIRPWPSDRLFAMWFISGVVMMYVAFPQLTDRERWAALPDIAWDQVRVPPDQAMAIRSAVRDVVHLRRRHDVCGVPAAHRSRAVGGAA